jgi:hypothetical protein
MNQGAAAEGAAPQAGGGGKQRSKLSMREAVAFLTKSPQMRCLAVMALAQGLSTNLIEIVWKNHLHMLHPSPAAYSARTPPVPLLCNPPAAGANATLDVQQSGAGYWFLVCCGSEFHYDAVPVTFITRLRPWRAWVACCSSALSWRPLSAQAFLGEVATWTGIVTGTLMFASPALFARWKWRGVAGATPAFMLWTGLPFFLGCVGFALARPPGSVGGLALRALVIVGAILQARVTVGLFRVLLLAAALNARRLGVHAATSAG